MKNILIKRAKIIDPNSKFNNKIKDILIVDGIIHKIADKISDKNVKLIEEDNLHICPGLFDMNVNFPEPGYEDRETLESGCNAAMAGGFTGVALIPDSLPERDNKSSIEYIINNTESNLVDVFPYGTVSKNKNGESLSEMFDMNNSGAVGFLDANSPIKNAGLLSRALLYAKDFDGLIISEPYDNTISPNGQMNEGIESTKIGLEGIPSLSEELQLSRDLLLTSYNNARLHISKISSGLSVPIIKEAKENKLDVSASVAIHNLILCDKNLSSFDSKYKLLPPLRTEDDKNELISALKNGIIDVITSDHCPQNIESKDCEFDIASFGAIGTQNAFCLAVTNLEEHLGLETIITKMSINPRTILRLDIPIIETNYKANITIFNPKKKWKFSIENNKSLNNNSPYFDLEMKCKIVGVINGEKKYIIN
jgi:dihydroorotase